MPDPKLVASIADEVIKRGKSCCSGHVLVLDQLNLEMAILKGMREFEEKQNGNSQAGH